MRNLLAVLLCSTLFASSCSGTKDPVHDAWEKQARNVTIIRDEYGVAHIYGKTDADCVFGLMYAQCEDDFKRVEDNYITMLGRSAEQKGKGEIYEDLLVRLTIDSAGARKDYEEAPDWLRKLLVAYADGINYYLYKHPGVKTSVIEKFEPWFPLMYTDGSISAIQTGGLEAKDLEAFYASKEIAAIPNQRHGREDKLIGSNGFAIAPSKSSTGNALFYINPHVTFYFRPEVHLQSEEGLHVYGAVTWGQFFVYQGFNEFCGFMHTSSSADAADLYAETVIQDKSGKYFYKYNDSLKPLAEQKVTIRYKEDGAVKAKTFTTYSTHHGPVMAMKDGKWLSLKTMNRSLTGLIQSWQRTKTKSLEEFRNNLDLKANLSNNTVYADAAGNIAYWHGNYLPSRDTAYNWEIPVDGSNSKTEWKGLHDIEQTVHIINPSNGWIQNTNNTPYSVSGAMSPARKNYPLYMAPDGENFRGINAVRLLSAKQKFSMDDLIAVGYDPHLAAFDISVPILISAHEKIKTTNPGLYNEMAEPIAALKTWDRNSGVNSVPTTLAIHWAEKMNAVLRSEDPELFADYTVRYGSVMRNTDPVKLLQPLKEVTDTLIANFGKWQVPWGEINRMQRIANSITPVHSDTAPSIPVGRAASTWGQLGSIVSRYVSGSHKRYATGGNSFVCVVEFGKRVKARSILAGGQSGDPASPHFFDQAGMYANGQFKEVHFYREDVLRNAKRTYHPGEK